MLNTFRRPFFLLSSLLGELNSNNNGNIRTLNSIRNLSISSSQFLTKPIADPNKYQLLTAFSGISKDKYFEPETQKKSLENPSGQNKYIVGEDSWFINQQKSCDVLGVADGVGGWRELGYDPSKISSMLMSQCKRHVDQEVKKFSNSQNINEKTPLEILSGAYRSMKDSKDPELIGSSTACVLVFNRDTKKLHSANLGDSGFVIVRNNKIVYRSSAQCHFFNCPYQLSLMTERLMKQGAISDRPEMADVATVELSEGDFILLATDGLWDNLNDAFLLEELVKLQNCTQEELDRVANSLTKVTFDLAINPDYLSPFAISARQVGRSDLGGKPDDITLLLAQVCKSVE